MSSEPTTRPRLTVTVTNDEGDVVYQTWQYDDPDLPWKYVLLFLDGKQRVRWPPA
jgi:hypothetical protein